MIMFIGLLILICLDRFIASISLMFKKDEFSSIKLQGFVDSVTYSAVIYLLCIFAQTLQ